MISLDFQPWGDLFLLKTLLPWFSKCPHFPAFSLTITQSPLWAPFFTHFFVSLHYHSLPSAGPHSPSSSSGTTWVAVTPSCVSQAHTSLQATQWLPPWHFPPGYDTCCQPCSLQHCSCLDTDLLKTPVTLPGTGLEHVCSPLPSVAQLHVTFWICLHDKGTKVFFPSTFRYHYGPLKNSHSNRWAWCL